jgi:hypothetical protein
VSGGGERNSSGRSSPFWVTRRGAMVAVAVTHLAALIAVLAEIVRPVSAPGAYPVKRVPALEFIASYAVYGFGACVLLVLVGILLRRLVMRDENYYRGARR